MKKMVLAMIFLVLIMQVQGKNLTVKVTNPSAYSDVWLGISTGDYKLVAEQGKDFEFKIYVKNGMAKRAINNLELHPRELAFQLNSITPKLFEQVKPMEIVTFTLNVSIPKDAIGKYPIILEPSADEFPQGVFQLKDEIQIVSRIRYELYAMYTLMIIAIFVALFVRKYRLK